MRAVQPCSPGTIVAGRYRIEALLGEGGMAHVYRAVDLAQRKPVALKVMRGELAMSAEALQRFSREGDLLRTRLQHPTIIGADTYGALEDGTLFLSMELLDGETLGARLRREGRFAPQAVAPILTGICAGLQFAHAQGVLHRDLKPDNVFLVRSASLDDVRVKILDFGISKITGAEKLTQTGQVVGTPRYMAPEQLLGEDLDVRSDVYALGVILYEMLAGAPPFTGAAPSDLIVAILKGNPVPLRAARPDLPPELDAIVMRAIAKSRIARYDTVVELANAFVSAIAPAIPAHARVESPADEAHETRALGSMSSTQLGRVRKRSSPPLEDGTFEHYAPRAGEPPHAPTLAGRASVPTRIGASESGAASPHVVSARAFAATEASVPPRPLQSPAAGASALPRTRHADPSLLSEPALTQPATPRSVRPPPAEAPTPTQAGSPRSLRSQSDAPPSDPASVSRAGMSTDEMLAQAGLSSAPGTSAAGWVLIVLAALVGAGFAAWLALKVL